MEYFKVAIGKGSNSNRTYALLGLIYFEIKNYKDAISTLEKAIKLDPNDGESLWNIAESYARVYNTQLAYKYGIQAKNVFQNNGQTQKAEKATQYLAKIKTEIDSQDNSIVQQEINSPIAQQAPPLQSNPSSPSLPQV